MNWNIMTVYMTLHEVWWIGGCNSCSSMCQVWRSDWSWCLPGSWIVLPTCVSTEVLWSVTVSRAFPGEKKHTGFIVNNMSALSEHNSRMLRGSFFQLHVLWHRALHIEWVLSLQVLLFDFSQDQKNKLGVQIISPWDHCSVSLSILIVPVNAN